MTASQNKTSFQIKTLLSKGNGHVHFAGVCGVGMAGLAFLLKARGFKVSGCDLVPGRMSEWLRERGVKFVAGHDPKHIRKDVDWVIRSAAVPLDGPEITCARKAGLPVFSRGMVLPELIKSFTSVAVGGTHGKTTTSTFITQLLKSAERQPSWCIGGEAVALGGVAGFRGRSEIGRSKCFQGEDVVVVEADESDGTLELYAPDIAVVTNIEFDHMEHFDSVTAFENCFRSFIKGARQKTIYCADDCRAASLCRGLKKTLSYGLDKTASIRGVDLTQLVESSSFTVLCDGCKLGRISLPVPGIHNILNALAATAVGLELGLTFEHIRSGLAGVTLPRRRFERIAEKDGITVISDYAHHPSEIKALVQTASKLKHSRLVAVFQPHRYTRTLALGPAFPAAFKDIDELVLVPVYEASEKPLKGGSIWDLYGHFRRQKTANMMKVSVATSLEQAWMYFRTMLRRNDLFLIIGAGDVEKIAGWAREEIAECRSSVAKALEDRLPVADLRNRLMKSGNLSSKLNHGARVRLNEMMAGKTTMGVGGPADVFINTDSLMDLRTVLMWTHENKIPLTLLGGGSNVVISDLGIRGVAVRLSGGDFGGITIDKNIVVAGSGVSNAKLLKWLDDHALAGLEFLEGIPGTVGGAVRMNAGAWGHEISKYISWIHCLNKDGSECTLRGISAGFAYRDCKALRDRILIEVGFKVSPDSVKSIRQRRMGIVRRRAWMKGLRSAGSIFKNPSGDFAGKLIERSGLKGAGVGGASISKKHANVIITQPGACASDVLALINKIREDVIARTGICLDTEVKFLE
ncbi:MAG: hypothetical protein A2283_05620 [Lentisphaerae bacterium RIFOXYA12_FULL_48_11]|nr:MAG: hypothetical protein A2283_05620 [Lentisphaerae bacterium RIFOXYA12_FULL_48_11]